MDSENGVVLKNEPKIHSTQFRSKNGRFVVTKTVIVDIKPMRDVFEMVGWSRSKNL